MAMQAMSSGPHQGAQVLQAGVPLDRARAVGILLHGRGARAENILELAQAVRAQGVAWLAPQAAGNTWYPNRFLVPIEENEPWLSSALAFLGSVLAEIVSAGIPAERVMLLGFSQGACLTLEFAARNAKHFGGIVGLSGALIGPDDTPRNYAGSLAGTPVFLGCSDVDIHVPKERVSQSAAVLQKLGGQVMTRLYPNMDHSVNQDEIEFVRGMMQALIESP